MSEVAPHAFDSALRDASAPAAAYVGWQMFDNNPTAMLITRARQVEHANPAAAVLLEAHRPITVAAGRLRFEDARAQAAFELLSRADHGADARRTFAFVVEGEGDRTFIAQLSLAKPRGGDATSVVVALTPFSGASQSREAMLQGFTDLTPTERAIFAAFVDGADTKRSRPAWTAASRPCAGTSATFSRSSASIRRPTSRASAPFCFPSDRSPS